MPATTATRRSAPSRRSTQTNRVQHTRPVIPINPVAQNPIELQQRFGNAGTQSILSQNSDKSSLISTNPETSEPELDSVNSVPIERTSESVSKVAGDQSNNEIQQISSDSKEVESNQIKLPKDSDENQDKEEESGTKEDIEKSVKAPTSPEEDPGFQIVVSKARQVAFRQGHNSPAQRKAAEAQAAAPAPGNDMSSQAADTQVDKMEAQEPSPFNRDAFKAALLAKIESITPNTLEDADDFKKKGKASTIKGEVVSQVESGKEQSQGAIKQTTEQAPDTSNAVPKEVVTRPPTEAGAHPGDIGGQNAAPKPKSESEVSLKAESQSLDDQMADSDITEEQLTNSNEPEFQGAVEEKRNAQTHAQEAPLSYRQQEQGIIDSSRSGSASSVMNEITSMHTTRGGSFSSISGEQDVTQTEDQAKRNEIGQEIESIYQQTKLNVESRLEQLDSDVNQKFDSGAESARQEFENHHSTRMRAYKNERYGGLTGPAKWAIDKLTGMPDEVNVFYSEARELYIRKMDAVIDSVATTVEVGLLAAKDLIRQGREKIKVFVANLEPALQSVGQQAADRMQTQFDSLEQEVNNKRDQLIDSLAQRYVENLTAVDARIDELKAANRGLVDAAFDAIAGVIATIIELKNMLLGVLARAGDVIGKIIKDPIGFIGNLVAAVGQGLQKFVANIGAHLQQGLMGWLFGALADAGIQMPASFDLKGILSLVMQVLGLTYANIRARAVRIIGEPIVARLEQVGEVFIVLVREGPAGLWQYIKDKVGDLKTMVIDGIKSFVQEKIIVAGITWIVSLLNPASAFIKACKAIYDIIMFFVTRGSQIMALVNAVIDSAAAIASGAIGGAAAAVEGALARAIPVTIGFLASLLGLGGISEKIRSIIMRIQQPINTAIDWVINKAVQMVKAAGNLISGAFGGNQDDVAETNDPEHDAKVTAGLAAIDTAEQAHLEGGEISREDAESVASSVKRQHPIFKTLQVVDGGETWDYDYTASPGDKKTGEEKMEETDPPNGVVAINDSNWKIDPAISVSFNVRTKFDPIEYDDQLQDQQRGINVMTVARWKENRSAYESRRLAAKAKKAAGLQHSGSGRSAEGTRHQRQARQDYRTTRMTEVLANLAGDPLHSSKTSSQLRSIANNRVDREMSRLHALHGPDQVAGGESANITGLGSARINMSIGAQWIRASSDEWQRSQEDGSTPRNRVGIIESAVDALALDDTGKEKTMMNVWLQPRFIE